MKTSTNSIDLAWTSVLAIAALAGAQEALAGEREGETPEKIAARLRSAQEALEAIGLLAQHAKEALSDLAA